MSRHSTLALFAPLVMLLASGAHAAADRCNPQASKGANEALEVGVADAPAGLAMRARTKIDVPLPVGVEKPRVDNGVLAEDLVISQPVLRYGYLVDDAARLTVPEATHIVVTAGEQRYRLSIKDGVTRGGKQELRLRPIFEPATALVVKRGSRIREESGKWTAAEGAELEWVATAQQPLKFALKDAATLTLVAGDVPGAAMELASERVSPGATVPLQVKGAGPTLNNATYRLCLTNRAGASVDVPAKRLSDQNEATQLAAVIPRDVITKLSSGPTWREWLWGEPMSLRVVAWADGRPTLELGQDVRLTRPWVGVLFGLGVLLVVYVFAALFEGVWRPLALFGQIIRHRKTGRYSLTSFQTLSWTLVVVFALCFSWYCSGVLLELRPDVLQLLGIVGAAHVLARGVEAAKPPSTEPAQPPRKVDLVTDSDTGEFDILRFQMLAFTLFSLGYVIVNVWFSHGLPTLPESLYWLMGLGNAVHVAGKVPDLIGPTAQATANLNAFEAVLSSDRIKTMQTVLGVTPTGVLDPATRDALVKYMSTNGFYPVGQISEQLLRRMGVPATP